MASNKEQAEESLQAKINEAKSYYFLLLESTPSHTAIIGNPLRVSNPVAQMILNQPPEPDSPIAQFNPPPPKSAELNSSLDSEGAVREFVRSLLTSPAGAKKPDPPQTAQKPIPAAQAESPREKLQETPSLVTKQDSFASFLPFSASHHKPPPTTSTIQDKHKSVADSGTAECSEDEDDDTDVEANTAGHGCSDKASSSCKSPRVRFEEPVKEGSSDQSEDDEEEEDDDDVKISPRGRKCFKRFKHDYEYDDHRGWSRCERTSKRSGSRKRR